ncbi:hypothetical protein GCM10023340_16170 [Nocardioides marinquilinus]|uniref:Integral membrane protein n=1 Tax=Nocardioides marinquilinus TaxID=1210400 RepID=A0ABP9PFZ8_9ACTN
MIVALIVVCEVAFWVLLGLGMLLRYPLRRRTAGAVVLALTPLVDVVLLVAAALDLSRGGAFETPHYLAAVYLGFSVAFGHRLVRWADVRFAHRFAGGPPPPPKPAKGSRERQAALWGEWLRVVLAAAVASAVLGLLALLADPDQRTAIVQSGGGVWVLVVLWLVGGPLWELPQRASRAQPSPAPAARGRGGSAAAAGGGRCDGSR